MGHEIICRASLGNRNGEGKALLESDHVLFRGDFRSKILFRDLTKVAVKDGTLRLSGPEGELRLKLGVNAVIWSQKILHPKPRAEKFGIKAGCQVAVVNLFDAELKAELDNSAALLVPTRSKRQCDLLFWGAQRAPELRKIPELLPRLKERGAIWIIYPKGQPEISQSSVILAGRAAGLKDVKVVSFSPNQTALKFVRPLKS